MLVDAGPSAALNAGTLGIAGTIRGLIHYGQTGDATAWQQSAGGQFVGALWAYGAKRIWSSPRRVFRFGGNEAVVTVENGVARLQIEGVLRLNDAFLNALLAFVRGSEAKRVVLNTGPIVNEALAASWIARAARGSTILGGRVVRLPDVGGCPVFEVIWELP